MEIQRYNIFYLVHKSLRALLYETALMLQKTDFQENDADEMLKKASAALKALESHERHERSYVLPAVSKYDEQAALLTEADHLKISGRINNIYNTISLFNACNTQALKVKVGRDIQSLFAELTGECLIHMHREENIVNEVLWRHFTDKDLLVMTGETLMNMSHDEMLVTMQHMVRGISCDELILVLRSLKNSHCHNLFNAIVKQTEASLDPQRWIYIQNSIAEGSVV